ncbi:MAG: hypothetical protein AAFY34_05955 [Pseudomonadota bacterium]
MPKQPFLFVQLVIVMSMLALGILNTFVWNKPGNIPPWLILVGYEPPEPPTTVQLIKDVRLTSIDYSKVHLSRDDLAAFQERLEQISASKSRRTWGEFSPILHVKRDSIDLNNRVTTLSGAVSSEISLKKRLETGSETTQTPANASKSTPLSAISRVPVDKDQANKTLPIVTKAKPLSSVQMQLWMIMLAGLALVSSGWRSQMPRRT